MGFCEATSVGKIRVVYFLEDRAQERFIKALVERVARDKSIASGTIVHDIRSARGGSRVVSEFEGFIRTTVNLGAAGIDFLVVAIDGNYQGHNERIRQLEELIKSDHPFKGRVVYAVPNPHIERWYLMDQRAFKKAIGLDKAPALPEYKCEKDYYKQLLRQALRDANINRCSAAWNTPKGSLKIFKDWNL
jgi:hypothetical protein